MYDRDGHMTIVHKGSTLLLLLQAQAKHATGSAIHTAWQSHPSLHCSGDDAAVSLRIRSQCCVTASIQHWHELSNITRRYVVCAVEGDCVRSIMQHIDIRAGLWRPILQI